jgi:hypothetical protein
MEKPTREHVRAGAGGVTLFSGSALLYLATTKPPSGGHYPTLAFWFAILGITVGIGTIAGTFIWPRPEPVDTSVLIRQRTGITKEDIEARRVAEEKRHENKRLTRKDKAILARTDLGVSPSSILEALGRQLDIGHFYPDMIRSEAEEFEEGWAAFLATKPDKEQAGVWLEEHLGRKAVKEAREWQLAVRARLSENLNYSIVARFDSDAGLLPSPVPPSITDSYYIDVWQHHDLRLQRLNQIIEELTDKWS